MKIKIPFFKTNFDFNEVKAFKKIVSKGNFSMGQSTIDLEKKIAKKLNISNKNVALVSSCTTALHLAMIVSNIKYIVEDKPNVLICTSTISGEGKTFAALNISLVLYLSTPGDL